MPNFISKDGVWFPSKEKVALVNRSNKARMVKGKRVKPGEPYIYEGADRAALFMFYEQGVDELGKDFRRDPEMVDRVRKLGFPNMDSYLEFIGHDKEKVEETFKKHAAIISKHELPKEVAAIKTLGGGRDYAGQGQDKYGGFGRQPDIV